MKIFWSDCAIERVTQIANFIGEKHPSASEKWVENIFDRAKQLITFPKSGRKVSEVNRSNIREIFYKNYRIIYKIETNQIIILTVSHVKQLLPIDDIDLSE